jgi:hypothetical protein
MHAIEATSGSNTFTRLPRTIHLLAGICFALFALGCAIISFLITEMRWIALAMAVFFAVKAALAYLLFRRTGTSVRSKTLLLRYEWRAVSLGYAFAAPLFMVASAEGEGLLGFGLAAVCVSTAAIFWLVGSRAMSAAAA